MKRQDLTGIPPKPPRRMLKPRKAALYERVEQQETEIERLRIDRDRLAAELETTRAPWWLRLMRKGR